jgi:hypothetical protein
MKRFIQTDLFLALKETQNSRSEEWEWEQMFDEFGDIIKKKCSVDGQGGILSCLYPYFGRVWIPEKGKQNGKKFIILKKRLC